METLIGGRGAGGPGGGVGGGEVIKEGSTATFAADVLEASRTVPVIVDFWAPWCGPCKQLGPLLEKLVRDARGALKLVKINVDENQELAAQMRVQSIPAVYAFKDGRPFDGFVGALQESQLKSFVSRLLGGAAASPIEEALEAAQAAFDEGDRAAAAEIYGQILEHEPGNVPAQAGLARCRLAEGDLAGARALLDAIPEADAGNATVSSVRAALELAEVASKAGPLTGLQDKLAANPNDHQTRLDLATALYAADDREAAVEELLELVRRDREWNEQAGRKQLVKLFEAFGPTDPLTVEARRRLSSLLFS